MFSAGAGQIGDTCSWCWWHGLQSHKGTVVFLKVRCWCRSLWTPHLPAVVTFRELADRHSSSQATRGNLRIERHFCFLFSTTRQAQSHYPTALFQDPASNASEFISWPTAPLKTDISFHVVDQTILLDLKKKKKNGWGRRWIFIWSWIFVFLNNWQPGGLPSSLFKLIRFRDEMFQHPKYFNCFCYETFQGDMKPCGIWGDL